MKYFKIKNAIVILSFLVVNALVLLGLGEVWAYYNKAEETSFYSTQAQDREFHQELTWLNSEVSLIGLDSLLRSSVEQDYLEAWAAWNKAFEAGDPLLLKEFFTTAAIERLKSLLRFNQEEGVEIKQINLAHRLRPVFLSGDKTLISLRDEGYKWVRHYFRDGQFLYQSQGEWNLELVLLLEDGRWRIRTFQEADQSKLAHIGELLSDTTKANQPLEPALKTAVDFQDKLGKISGDWSGFNYYPAETPWDHFGSKYNPDIMDADLRMLQEAGVGVLRIFIPYQASGGPDLKPSYLKNILDFFDRAAASEILLIPTLFDFYSDYSMDQWPANIAYMRKLIPELSGHPALLAWDLKNEPDLDFETRNRERVLSWLKIMTENLKEMDPETPLTIGWSQPEQLSLLQSNVDFHAFHYYGTVEDFTERVNKNRAGLKKPVILEEFGKSSYGGFWSLFSGSEKSQDSFFESILPLIREQQIPNLAWTLYDFEEVPETVVGRKPWRKNPQRKFGLVTEGGVVKPAGTRYFEFIQNKKGADH